MEKQENNSTIPGRFQKSVMNFLTTKQKMTFQTAPIQEEKMEPKSAEATSLHHAFQTYRFKELQNNAIENIPKENSSKEFKNFTKNLVAPSKRNLSKFFNAIEENEINLSNNTDMNVPSKGKGLSKDAVTQDRFIRGHQQNQFADKDIGQRRKHRQHKLAKGLDMADVHHSHEAERDTTLQENVMKHYDRNKIQKLFSMFKRMSRPMLLSK
ncbi:hypothetical protein CEXT_404381 [Caerostris extrusa]|uniref:Uncharacterized protein n=1 Tax=Caerostris extrusa TaxID=172846 RepID=A0AAV4XPZ7_CAEEX|nr:hypothetical protein CEXT_404381 [Caerostris extrusa]